MCVFYLLWYHCIRWNKRLLIGGMRDDRGMGPVALISRGFCGARSHGCTRQSSSLRLFAAYTRAVGDVFCFFTFNSFCLGPLSRNTSAAIVLRTLLPTESLLVLPLFLLPCRDPPGKASQPSQASYNPPPAHTTRGSPMKPVFPHSFSARLKITQFSRGHTRSRSTVLRPTRSPFARKGEAYRPRAIRRLSFLLP